MVQAPRVDPELDDPLAPGRRPTRDPSRSFSGEDWVRARPLQTFQYSLPASRRGGVEPCGTPAPAEALARVAPLGKAQLYVPDGVPDASGDFDLVLHLHGNATAVRELAASRQPFVLWALTLPLGQSYGPMFSGPALFGGIVDQISAAVTERTGRPARARRVAATAWSAGFEGIRALLHQPRDKRLDAVLLIDGLHAPRDTGVFAARMAPFVRFAEGAARGEQLMLITHSSIPTQPYASTTETAHHVVHELGGKPVPVKRDDGFGLELVEFFTRGQLFVRGYAGNDKADHCAQLFLLRTAFEALGRRWAGQR